MASGMRVWKADELGEQGGFKLRVIDADEVLASASTNFVADQAQAWRDVRAWADDQIAMVEVEPGAASPNGPGSSWQGTAPLRAYLSDLLSRHQVHTMLDAPCGDWNWMQHIDLSGVRYTGWDVDAVLVSRCAQRAGERTFTDGPFDFAPRFEVCNVLEVDEVPKVDLILCRDFLAHLPNEYVAAVLEKFAASGSRFLLASNYPDSANDFVYNPMAYSWVGYCEHPVNLEAPPFNLAGKVGSITETCGPAGVLTCPHELALFRL